MSRIFVFRQDWREPMKDRTSLIFVLGLVIAILAALTVTLAVTTFTRPAPPAPTVEAVVELEGLLPLDSLGERWMYVVTSGQDRGEVMDAAAALIFSVPPGRYVVQNCVTYSDSSIAPPLGSRVISTCDFRRVTEKQVIKHYEKLAQSSVGMGRKAGPEA